MHNSYVIETSSVGVLQSSFLLLDTNFLIDASIFRAEAVDLIAELRKMDCELVTTRAVLVEFLGGTKNPVEYDAKVLFVELLFGKTLDKIVSLPIDSKLPNKTDLLDFSRQCQKFAPTDFELFLTLKKYSHSSLILISRNHTDFTSRLFKRKGFITLLGDKEIRTYGLYTT
jgi:hypothetical protein